MATDMGRGIIAPDTTDKISATGVDEMRTIASSAAAALDALDGDLLEALLAGLAGIPRFDRGAMPSGAVLDDYNRATHGGLWRVSSAAVADTITGLPSGVKQCNILVLPSDAKVSAQLIFPYGATDAAFVGVFFYRNVTDVVAPKWSEWAKIGASVETLPFYRGAVPAASNLDEWHLPDRAGLWGFSSGGSADLKGLPASAKGRNGKVLILPHSNSVSDQIYFPYGFYGEDALIRSVSNVSTKEWTSWEPFGGGPGGGNELTEVGNHAVEASESARRRGGSIGTDKPVIALRFDHGLTNFQAVCLPLLTQYGFPASLCLNSRNWHYPENEGVTAAIVNEWVRAYGLEIANHSGNHRDATGAAAIHDNIVGGRDELRTQIPSSAVDVFMPAGLEDGALDGFGGGKTVEAWQTLTGKTILGAHGIATGYMPGMYRDLSGRLLVGQTHWTLDKNSTLDAFKERVDLAVTTGTGFCIMIHPSLIGSEGNVTAAGLDADFAYLAQLRAEGKIELMTVGGLSLAEMGSSRRSRWKSSTSSIEIPSTLFLPYRGASRMVTGTVAGAATVTVTHSSAGTIASKAVGDGKFWVPFTVAANLNSGSYTISVTGGVVTGLECSAI